MAALFCQGLGPLAGRDPDPAAPEEGGGPRPGRPQRQEPPPGSRFLFAEHTPYKERREQARRRLAPARGLGD